MLAQDMIGCWGCVGRDRLRGQAPRAPVAARRLGALSLVAAPVFSRLWRLRTSVDAARRAAPRNLEGTAVLQSPAKSTAAQPQPQPQPQTATTTVPTVRPPLPSTPPLHSLGPNFGGQPPTAATRPPPISFPPRRRRPPSPSVLPTPSAESQCPASAPRRAHRTPIDPLLLPPPPLHTL